MAAMIWDEQVQAFVEATNTPMVYDPASDAFAETTGLVWDPESRAWEKAWNKKPSKIIIEDYGVRDYGNLWISTDGNYSSGSYENDHINLVNLHSANSVFFELPAFVDMSWVTNLHIKSYAHICGYGYYENISLSFFDRNNSVYQHVFNGNSSAVFTGTINTMFDIDLAVQGLGMVSKIGFYVYAVSAEIYQIILT